MKHSSAHVSQLQAKYFFIYRECLCHVLKEKTERYKTEKKEDLELEEYLKTLLENEVKPLWPKGWMQSRYDTDTH